MPTQNALGVKAKADSCQNFPANQRLTCRRETVVLQQRFIKTFILPTSIAHWQFSELPASPRLSGALKKLRIHRLGDLNRISATDLGRVSNLSSALMLELDNLIRLVRTGKFPSAAATNPNLAAPVAHAIKSKSALNLAGPLAAPGSQRPSVLPSGKPEAARAKTICIPEEARGQPVSSFPLSARLAHILEFRGFHLLGDLDGVRYAEFVGLRNCGRKTLQELRELVETIQHTYPWPQAFKGAETPLVLVDHFFIPAKVHGLNPFDLNLPVRLERALQEKRITRLGDLHGMGLGEFRRLRNFGWRTMDELIRLIERAAAGDFDVAQAKFSPSQCRELLRALDDVLAKLPAREREICFLRFGTEGNRPLTLKETGAFFQLTRERVRQITAKAAGFILKEGGPKLSCWIRGLAAACLDMVCPLTPALLSHWLGQNPGAFWFSPATYVCLLGEVDPQLPAWPNGQEPSGSRKGVTRTVSKALIEILRAAPPAMPLKTALESLRSHPMLHDLTAADFLATLKHSRNVCVDLSKPDEPVAQIRWQRPPDSASELLIS
jgi:DNA-directed RNA polymerase alpha subunit